MSDVVSVQAALITGLFAIFSSIIVAIINRKSRKETNQKLDKVVKDVQYVASNDVNIHRNNESNFKNHNYTSDDILLDMNNFDEINRYQDFKLSTVKSVLSEVTHTMATPISGIELCVEHLRSGKFTNEKNNEILEDISKYLNQIKDNLISYDNLYSNSLKYINDEMVNLSSFLTDLLHLTVLTTTRKINTSTEGNCEIIIRKNIVNILQIPIMVILENAVAFTPDNGKITMNFYKQEKQLQIDIINTVKKEVSNETVQRAFDDGYSTRNSKGKGLYLTKSIIEKHLNGTISFNYFSEPYKYVNVSIKFEVKSL